MAQALLAGAAANVGQKLVKKVLPQIIDKVSTGVGRLWEGATGENRGEFWEGVKEGGRKILSGDFSGALDQAAGFLGRKSPTEIEAEALANAKGRPKDVVRKNMPTKKPKKKKAAVEEEEDIEEGFELVDEIPEGQSKYKAPPMIAATKAPVRVPKIVGTQPPLPRPAGGVKPVPADPYAKMEFTRSSLFPQPKTSVERRRAPPESVANIPDVVSRLERIYGPMDTTVRALKRQQSVAANRQGGAFKWTTFGQSEFGNTSGPPATNRDFLPSPAQMTARVTMRDRMNAMMHVPEPGRQAPAMGSLPSYLSASIPRPNRPLLGPPLPKQKAAARPDPLEAPAAKVAAEIKTGKPLKGAAKASFEKAQVKITVPKKKLVKK